MPAQPFTVHLDPDALAERELATAVPPAATSDSRESGSEGRIAEHHGARDRRQSARQQSERARSGRASGAGGVRAYAFRRS
jgi:hypothetical protein